jgi:hypothetical protein
MKRHVVERILCGAHGNSMTWSLSNSLFQTFISNICILAFGHFSYTLIRAPITTAYRLRTLLLTRPYCVANAITKRRRYAGGHLQHSQRINVSSQRYIDIAAKRDMQMMQV